MVKMGEKIEESTQNNDVNTDNEGVKGGEQNEEEVL